jgi:hypothetical protein
MDTKTAERALTKFWADALDLTVDANIFRGGIPASKPEGVAVIMGTEITGNDPAIKKYNVQILGKYDDRDAALQLVEDVSNALPCYEQTVTLTDGIVTLRAMLKRGSGGTWTQADDGQKKTYASFNLIAAFAAEILAS